MIGFEENTWEDYKISEIFLKSNLRISVKNFWHAVLSSHSSLRDVLLEIIQDVPKDDSYFTMAKNCQQSIYPITGNSLSMFPKMCSLEH